MSKPQGKPSVPSTADPAMPLDLTPWGKARGLDRPYPLVGHMLDAAAAAERLWDTYISPSQRRVITRGLGLEKGSGQARAIVALCAALHDIGKLSPGFQAQDEQGWAGLSSILTGDLGLFGVEKISHAQAGMEAAPGLLRQLGYGDEGGRSPLWMIPQIIGGHHGRFSVLNRARALNPCFLELLGGAAWSEQRLLYVRTAHQLLGAPEPPPECSASCAVLVTGLVILADWLVSQESYLRGRQTTPATSLSEHLAQACKSSAGLLDDAGLVPVQVERKDFTEAHRIPAPNPLQQSIIDDLASGVAAGGPGILLVTAATGDGKTEAALEAERVLAGVSGTRGFAFLLPTMATSDQMYERVSGFVGRQSPPGASVTLTHSMAWLNSAYSEDALASRSDVLVCEETAERGSGGAVDASVLPRRWLRGAKRPLLAQFAVGTIDQALMAVLPVKHNALRMLALSGKTFIVDEAHAYDPYMQVLLGRLLNWLGAYGCPVVLLSATLPVSVSDRLIKEYLRGAGHKRSELKNKTFGAPYPGWLFVDAERGETRSMPDRYQKAQASERHIKLTIQQELVKVASSEKEPGRPLPATARLRVIERLLEPISGPDGGCVLVVCTTVDEAQQTYVHLRDGRARLGVTCDEIELLHARMPGDEREARSRRIASALGRSGSRPLRRIIVATQVVEQSLDLDADLVISDLAPLAQLVQRAGRCWRHEQWWARHGRPAGRPRPSWAAASGPRLVVLDPLLNGGSVPRRWGAVYSEFLLHETSAVLADRGEKPLRVPEEVQDLVERVHGDRADRYDWERPENSVAWSAHVGESLAMQTAGGCVAIPRAREFRGLEALHKVDASDFEWDLATRLGADSRRVLCVYERSEGRTTLDEAGSIPLPEPSGSDRLRVADVRAVMRRTIPVRATLLSDCGETQQPPEAWQQHPMLADLVLLRHQVSEGAAAGVQIGRRHFRLDGELGLVQS